MMQVTKSVKNPGKQRQRLFNAPAHIRHKLMSAHLAPDLVKSHGVKSLPVRKGDTVRIMRGDHEGFEGKISTVDLANYRIFLEGLTREKVDGTVIFVSVHPSKVLIKTLNLDDKWRKRALQRKKPLEKREEAPAVAKPAKEVAKPPKVEVKPKEEKPGEAKPKVTAAKPKRVAKVKAEKPVEAKIEPAETKVEAPAEVKVAEKVEVVAEKPVVKKPRAAKKAVAKAEAKVDE
jgi:large subunit ribosomal protein L24